MGLITQKEIMREVKVVQIDVRGDIISNDDKWIYDWLDWDPPARQT